MKIYPNIKKAGAAAQTRANAEGQAIVIFRGPNTDHILVPLPNLRTGGIYYPGGRECWTDVQTVQPSQESFERRLRNA